MLLFNKEIFLIRYIIIFIYNLIMIWIYIINIFIINGYFNVNGKVF